MKGNTENLEGTGHGYGGKLSYTVTGILAVIGLYIYLSGFAYLETGHIVLFVLFIGTLIGLFFTLKKFSPIWAVLCVLLYGTCIFVSAKKIDWQRDYIRSLQGPNPFLFEAYIDRYPTWEGYVFAELLKKSDWIRFTNQCAKPALKDKPVDAYCRSYKAIQERYNINMQEELEKHLGKMQATAQMIEKGQITTKKRYEACLSGGRCAQVPLLPAGIDADKVDPNSEDYIEIRRPFWQLVNAESLTPEICDFMTLCAVLRKTGALRFEQSQ